MQDSAILGHCIVKPGGGGGAGGILILSYLEVTTGAFLFDTISFVFVLESLKRGWIQSDFISQILVDERPHKFETDERSCETTCWLFPYSSKIKGK